MTTTTQEHAPYVLFVGETDTARALLNAMVPQGGYVYHPQSLMETLGMYITMMPRVIVIDTCAPFASDVYLHLRSVDARPIILLTDPRGASPAGFSPARELGVTCIARTATTAELMRAICKVAAESSAFGLSAAFAPSEYLDEALAFAN